MSYVAVSIVTRLRVGRPGFNSRQCIEFLFATMSGPILGPAHPPIKWVPRSFTPGIKHWGREADLPSVAEVKNARSCISTPSIRLLDLVLG
jgi:hypothetical protein